MGEVKATLRKIEGEEMRAVEKRREPVGRCACRSSDNSDSPNPTPNLFEPLANVMPTGRATC